MLQKTRVLRSLGIFANDCVSHCPNFDRLTLIYGENGRGKTTLTSVLRSLSIGKHELVLERKTLGVTTDPEVIISFEGHTKPVIFKGSHWSESNDNLVIFDDIFTFSNVHVGHEVTTENRQNLHELMLGEVGVSLSREVERLTEEIATVQSTLKEKLNAVAKFATKAKSVDQYCALKPIDEIDSKILELERAVTALKNSDKVLQLESFDGLSMPSFDFKEVSKILGKSIEDIDATAHKRLTDRFAQLGKNAEKWVSMGTSYQESLSAQGDLDCPYCAQSLGSSELIQHYRAYFGLAYTELKKLIASKNSEVMRQLGGDSLLKFEQSLLKHAILRASWSEYLVIPPSEWKFDSFTSTWKQIRDELLSLFDAKQSAPLDTILLNGELVDKIEEFESFISSLSAYNVVLEQLNASIAEIKATIPTTDLKALELSLDRLKMVAERFTSEVHSLCADYLSIKKQKEQLEAEKVSKREALDSHRDQTLPKYQQRINTVLSEFNAGFRINQVEATNSRGIPSVTYRLQIESHMVPLSNPSANPPQPAFKTALSAGDRNTLALAFFFAQLDQFINLSDKIVVIDDPASSLDDGRAISTARAIRLLKDRTKQVIVFSHSKRILCQIWELADKSNTVTIEIIRGTYGSRMMSWAIADAAITEYDRRHNMLRNYVAGTEGDHRAVCQALRPTLEGYLRVAFPEHFPPGTMLGAFINKMRQLAQAQNEVLPEPDLAELEALKDYGNLFHHDSNPGMEYGSPKPQ